MTKKTKRYLFLGTALLLLCVAFVAILFVSRYTISYKQNVAHDAVVCIPTNANFETVLDSLRVNNILLDEAAFIQVSQHENYTENVRSGRYKLKAGMTNKELVRKLKVGSQDAVNLVIAGNIRENEKLAAVLSRNIEADSLSLLQLLSNDSLLQTFGYTPATVIGMIVPNTYQVYWNVSPENLLQRLYKEYTNFWNGKRAEQLKTLGLTQDEVIVLASIVNEETNKTDEMQRVAGVYMNRIKIGMVLQADPTLKYAWGDFTLQRVLDKHKTIDSPYNTYKHQGLPPGPICIPSIAAIDAVLEYEQHSYFYFCAKEDFSGYHVFAKTLTQHNQNANKYRNALNKNRIFR